MLSNIRTLSKIMIRTDYNNKLQALIPPILFDVSLRDGLQGLSKERQETFTLNKKKDIFHNIMFNYKPKNIEIGSLVNPKILPIMEDSLQLYDYADNFIKNVEKTETNLYIVVPNEKGFNMGISRGIKNYSFLTSVSNSFQKRNVNKTLLETKKELKKIFKIMETQNTHEFKTKLYISCITDCPLEGKMDNDYIIHEILYYNADFPNIDEFCLSDTCGSLKFEDYKYIVENCVFFGLQPSKISLHLHVKKQNIEEIKQIVKYSMDNNINRFDVSILESGGCSLTIPSTDLLPNASYELLNAIYKSYHSLEEKIR
jgi:hydroxymethylglutaryl-CoA lyase